jgi:hypothetical protein
MSVKNANVKKRNWAFVLYPESAPENWMDILKQSGLQCAVSPLHDKDINPDEHEKKAHFHIILVYGGPTTYSNVQKFTEGLNSSIPVPLEQIRGYYRYLTHKDNPEKYQYDEKEIKTVNGFNIADFIELSKNEVNEIKMRLFDMIINEDMFEYFDFIHYLLRHEMYLEFDIASNNTFFFSSILKSRRHSKNAPLMVVTVNDNGEILSRTFVDPKDIP